MRTAFGSYGAMQWFDFLIIWTYFWPLRVQINDIFLHVGYVHAQTLGHMPICFGIARLFHWKVNMQSAYFNSTNHIKGYCSANKNETCRKAHTTSSCCLSACHIFFFFATVPIMNHYQHLLCFPPYSLGQICHTLRGQKGTYMWCVVYAC